ncbi:unnamed protein product, partial [Iphiclides podalirius]
MYMCLAVIPALLATCYCFAGYDLFKGFDVNDETPNATTLTTSIAGNLSTNTDRSYITSNNITKFKCPEEEEPISIGPYEVPTQRDLVLMTKTIMTKLFNAFYQEVLFLIKDIKEATKASTFVEKKCPEINKAAYRQCVKRVSRQSELTVKNLIAAVENRKIDVAALTEFHRSSLRHIRNKDIRSRTKLTDIAQKDKICNLTSMKTDPLELIKILSQENASIQFALPGFLRLLNSCSSYCSQSYSKALIEKKPDMISDLELVVKHFLTHKNYLVTNNLKQTKNL